MTGLSRTPARLTQASTMGTNMGNVLPSRQVQRTESITSKEPNDVQLQPEGTESGSSQHSKVSGHRSIQQLNME